MMVTQVPALHTDRVWPMVAPFIASALAHSAGHLRPEDVRAEIMTGHRQLWIGSGGGPVQAVCVTKVAEYPSTRALWVHESAGTIEAVRAFWPALKAFAKEWACDTICFYGRRGWRRGGVLPPEFRHASDLWIAEV